MEWMIAIRPRATYVGTFFHEYRTCFIGIGNVEDRVFLGCTWDDRSGSYHDPQQFQRTSLVDLIGSLTVHSNGFVERCEYFVKFAIVFKELRIHVFQIQTK